MNGGAGADVARSGPGLMTDGRTIEPRMKTVLLHSCCGPCSTSVVERLVRDYQVTVYFYNPNITDENEYRRRLEAQRDFINIYNSSEGAPARVGLIVGTYDPGVFLSACEGYESEPEGGARCVKCCALRLERTAGYAAMHGYDCFTTTLSVSPHKDHRAIARIGGGLALQYGVDFLADDFKKGDGYKRSVELSRAYGLYRQDYCGCVFSARDGG